MRIPKNFGQRKITRESSEAAKKYFLIFEGSETEVQYFNGINDSRISLGINPLIDIKPLLRSYNETGWSNPKKILNRLIEYVDESNTGKITIKSLVNKVVDFLLEDGIITRNSVYSADDIYNLLLKNILDHNNTTQDQIIDDLEKIVTKVSNCLKEKANITKAVEHLTDYISKQNIIYEEGFDKICLIVDRDKGSFVSSPYNDQYEYVKNKCLEKGYNLYLTNPCFEFWLLMHFDSVHELNIEKLTNNPRMGARKRFTEVELKKVLPGYKKNDVRFKLLKSRIDIAIKNEKYFCEDIGGLKDHIGSNIGLLFEELKDE